MYNPAAINSKAYGLDAKNYTGYDEHGMTVFVVEGEFLSTFNKAIGAVPIDKYVTLPKQKGGAFDNHSMKAVIKALDEANYE